MRGMTSGLRLRFNLSKETSHPMKNIKIKRCEGEQAAKYQGYLEPEDGSWRLFLDNEGFPHLIVRTNIEDDEGKTIQGMFNIENAMHEGMRIKDIMMSTFGGQCPESDEELAAEFSDGELDFGPGPHDFILNDEPAQT